MNSLFKTGTSVSGYVHLVIIYLVWGSTYLAIRIGVQDGGGFPPLIMASSRGLVGSFILLILIKGVILIGIFSRFKFIKNWLLSLKPSGSGPNKKKRDTHWFKAIFIGEGENERVHYEISGGDPGYGETSKFISEIALCILLQQDELIEKKGIQKQKR